MAKKLGSCRCTFGGLRQDFATGDIEMVLKIHKDSKASSKKVACEAKNLDLTISLEKYAEKRSLNANSYFWLLCGKLAAVLNIGMEEIYREYIKNIGDNFEIVSVPNDGKERWIKNWNDRGIGWICEDLGVCDKYDDSNIICYYGSSTYDSHQMYLLTEMLIFDCEEQGIETLPPDKLEMMLHAWHEKQAV